jgi:hypothetical protein
MPIINSLRVSKGNSPAPYLASHALRSLDPAPITSAVALDTEYLASLNALNPLKHERSSLQREVAEIKKRDKKAAVDPAVTSKLAALSKEVKLGEANSNRLKAQLDEHLSRIANVVDTDTSESSFDIAAVESGSNTAAASSFVASTDSTPDTLLHLLFSDYFSSHSPLTLPTPKKGNVSAATTTATTTTTGNNMPARMLATFTNAWMPMKSLPSSHSYVETSTTKTVDDAAASVIHMLTLTQSKLTSSRLAATDTVQKLVDFIKIVGLLPTVSVMPPTNLALSSCSTVTISVDSTPIATVTNSTDYFTEKCGIRAGVKQMIQITIDYCHSVSSTVDLKALVAKLDARTWMANLPSPVVLAFLENHLAKYTYLGGYTVSDLDITVLAELNKHASYSAVTIHPNIKRWGNHMEKISARR